MNKAGPQRSARTVSRLNRALLCTLDWRKGASEANPTDLFLRTLGVRQRADSVADPSKSVQMEPQHVSPDQLLIESKKLRETAIDMMEHAALLITKSIEIDEHTSTQRSRAEEGQVAWIAEDCLQRPGDS